MSFFSIDFDTDDESFSLDDDLHAKLNEYLSRHLKSSSNSGSIGLEYLSPVVRDVLAVQRLKELYPSRQVHRDHEVQARAALIPINVSKTPVLMRYRTLDVGQGGANQLDLEGYGHCNYISVKHATVYFDQISQVFELINYSEHGTIVDNVVYALQSSRSVSKRVSAAAENATKMSDRTDFKPCHCQTSMAALLSENQGCENSAILQHGSYIRMGCLQFVFSIMQYNGGVEDVAKDVKEDKKDVAKTKEEQKEEEQRVVPDNSDKPKENGILEPEDIHEKDKPIAENCT